MEEKKQQGSKRRRASSFQPNAAAYAGFLCRYIGYLLPALAEAAADATSHRQAKGRNLKKAVRFEVDMALVLSESGPKWSGALKRKLLEHGNGGSELRESFSACRLIAGSFEPSMNSDMFPSPAAAVPRPLALITAARPVSINLRSTHNKVGGGGGDSGGDDEFSRGMRTLRRILPGGKEMCLSELLCEARSYMVCLKLQVSILRTLVEIH